MAKALILVHSADYSRRGVIQKEIADACKDAEIEATVSVISNAQGLVQAASVKAPQLVFVHVHCHPEYGPAILRSLSGVPRTITTYTLADCERDEPRGSRNHRITCLSRTHPDYRTQLRRIVDSHLPAYRRPKHYHPLSDEGACCRSG